MICEMWSDTRLLIGAVVYRHTRGLHDAIACIRILRVESYANGTQSSLQGSCNCIGKFPMNGGPFSEP